MKKVFIILAVLLAASTMYAQQVIKRDLDVQGSLFHNTVGSDEIYLGDYKVYVSVLNGDDKTGNGSESKPYKTFGKAIMESPDFVQDGKLYVYLDSGNYYASDMVPYIKGCQAPLVIVGDYYYTGDSLDNMQVSGMFSYRTSTTMTPGQYRGGYFIENRRFANFLRPLAIYDNTADEIFYGRLVPPLYTNIVRLSSKIIWDVGIVYNMDEVQFITVHIEIHPASDDLGIELNNCTEVYIYSSYISSISPVYDMFAVHFSNDMRLWGTYLEGNPSSGAGEVIESYNTKDFWITRCVIEDRTAGQPQGIDILSTDLYITESFLNGFTKAIKMESGYLKYDGCYFEDIIGGALYVEEEGFCEIFRADLDNIDTTVLVDVDYFIEDRDDPVSGRHISMPLMELQLGTAEFSNKFTNNTYDISKNIYVNVGEVGEVSLIIGQFTGSLTDGAPTDSQIDTITGTTPSEAGAGWQTTIKDSDGTGLLYRIESDGTNWFYEILTQAL